jgi:hypothetical protein
VVHSGRIIHAAKEEGPIAVCLWWGDIGAFQNSLRVRGVSQVSKYRQQGLLEEAAVVTLLILGRVDLEESSIIGLLFCIAIMENFFPIDHFRALNFEHTSSALFAREGASYSTFATGLFSAEYAVTVFWGEGLNKAKPALNMWLLSFLVGGVGFLEGLVSYLPQTWSHTL